MASSQSLGSEPPASAPVRYAHSHLPEIDYPAHSAYAGAPTPGERLKALGLFARGFSIAGVRWFSDFEHSPKPPAGSSRARWLLGHAPALTIRALKHNLRRLRPRAFPASGEAAVIAEALDRDGVFVFRLSPEQQAEITRLTAPWFERIETRLLQGVEGFDDNRIWIDEASDPEPYRWFRGLLADAGVIGGSCARLGRPVTVAHLIPQINTPATDFWTGQFADIGEPDPACNYCHVDTAWGITKMIIYLGEVSEAEGPFCYVRGSQRARVGFWERLIRKANDYAGLSSTRPAMRRLFAALPAPLRRKAAFGPDVQDTHPLAADLLAAEWRITSDYGQAILFDPDGVHRGGMVRKGERRVIGVLLAEI